MKLPFWIVPFTLLFGCTMAGHVEPANEYGDLPRSMEELSHIRVFFGHQSVGENILAGLHALMADSSLPRLRIIPLDSSLRGMTSYLAHGAIGKNGSPNTKCDAFAKIVRSLAADSLQLALMKFCFVDFGPETNVDDLFRYYSSTITQLEADCPNVKIVHVTAPLVGENAWWKRVVKSILGREESTELRNRKINRFNRLLTSTYSANALFDLATRESTFGNGTRSVMAGSDSTDFALIGDYTSDGGHLNQRGSELAAKEFIISLARAIK